VTVRIGSADEMHPRSFPKTSWNVQLLVLEGSQSRPSVVVISEMVTPPAGIGEPLGVRVPDDANAAKGLAMRTIQSRNAFRVFFMKFDKDALTAVCWRCINL